ncbi:hypothetical protein FE236_01445 [Mariprofundus erugo]|uniref:Uncharacterized protein n=1 Tax=Mariprofundus erugo TaxID=2528639 RepID=A0A5R9GJ69_9PROT|nr:hypothetical protein [Mariprofundus erugo]TLS66701.1 hypothetical protein FEF65_09250 [Mariprofundus erugo]TLS78473.1 hypothetical protein FE236_01445 [Mariprofundus erugo]
MQLPHAALAGSLTGLLFGLAVCLIQNIPVVDSLYRIMILTFAGAWMGMLLAWLNQLLPTRCDDHSEHQDSGV